MQDGPAEQKLVGMDFEEAWIPGPTLACLVVPCMLEALLSLHQGRYLLPTGAERGLYTEPDLGHWGPVQVLSGMQCMSK